MTDGVIARPLDSETLVFLDDCTPEQATLYHQAYYNKAIRTEISGATMGKIAPWIALITFGAGQICAQSIWARS